MTVLPLPFQFGYRLFLFLVWLLWKRLPILYWIEMIKCENPCFLVPEFSRKALAFHFGVLCCLWVCHKSLLLCCEMLPLYLGKRYFGKSFFLLWMLSYGNAFSKSSEIMWLLSSAYVLYHIDLPMLTHHCEPGMNPTWSWYTIFSVCLWIWFANILLRIFASIFIKSIGL